MAANRVVLAEIGAPHGVRGEVRLNVFAEDLDLLTRAGPLTTQDGREVIVTSVRPHATRLIARLAGVTDRDAAAALTGQHLLVDRAALPAIEENDTWYQADLVGLTAVLGDGTEVGSVTAVQDFGAGDLLEITGVDGQQVLVPFTREVVPEIDLEAGRVRVDPPPGLID